MVINIGNIKYLLKNLRSIRYRCTNKNCQSSIYVDNDVTEVLSVLNEHNHNIIIPKNIVSRQIVNSRIKRKCENDLFRRPNKIIRQELRSTENDLHSVHSDIKLWWKSMYDFRKKKLPTIPKSLEESKFQLFNLRDILKTNTQEHFCYMEEISNIVVFTCPTQCCQIKISIVSIMSSKSFDYTRNFPTFLFFRLRPRFARSSPSCS